MDVTYSVPSSAIRKRNQEMIAKAAELREPPASLDFADNIGKDRIERRRCGRVQHGADLGVARDLLHAEQRSAIPLSLLRIESLLVPQERPALQTEH